MSFKSKVNVYRRKLTHSLTFGLGKNSPQTMQKKAHLFKMKRVLISRPNHRLGNMLMVTPLVEEICENYPDCTIDLFVKGKIAPIIFQNYPQINQIIELPKKPFKEFGKYLAVWIKLRRKKYDLVINVEKGSSSGRISALIARSEFKFFGDDFEGLTEKYSDYEHMAKFPVYNFRQFLRVLNQKVEEREVPKLSLRLDKKEIAEGKIKLDEITKDTKRETIAFFTYATGTKCFPVEWWDEFYQKFYPKYSKEFNLIEILPVENISQLDNKLPAFYSKDIREIASVMENCKLLLAADSGMMHLGCASQVPTIGLFSVSNSKMYAPYGGQNTVLDMNKQTQEDIIRQMDKIIISKN